MSDAKKSHRVLVAGRTSGADNKEVLVDSNGVVQVAVTGGGSGGAVTIADGADVTLGAKADTASTDSTSTNTAMSFFKGLVKILFDVWDSTNHRLNTAVQAMPANTLVTGTITATNQHVDITVPAGASSIGVQITGTWTGQLDFQATVDGSNYNSIYITSLTSVVNATGSNGTFIAPSAGIKIFRVFGTSITGGTGANVNLNASIGSSGGFITGPLPAGTNAIGSVNIGGLNLGNWDYMSLAVASTTDTFTFKSGGAGGSTVATVTITYTDNTKATISTVVKT